MFSASFHGNLKLFIIGKFQATEGGGLSFSIISLSVMGFLVFLCA